MTDAVSSPAQNVVAMKQGLLVLGLWISIAAAAQEEGPIPRNADGKYEYVEVVKAPGLTADAIFERAQAWVNAEYKNPRQKIQVLDKAGHRLVLKHKVRVPRHGKHGAPDFFVHYKLSIETKDGRYRYRIFKLHENRGGGRFYPIERWTDKQELPPKAAQAYLQYLDKELRALAERLKKYVASPPASKRDDW